MKEDTKAIIARRLGDLFGTDTQEVIASKLNTSQGNVSKWLSGKGVPPVEVMCHIARTYDVSIDWIVGLSDRKRINEIDYNGISYEQAAKVLDYLLLKGTIAHPDMSGLMKESASTYSFDEPEYDAEEESEEDIDGMKPESPFSESGNDTDYLMIRDRLLSFFLRQRSILIKMDQDFYELWNSKLQTFQDARLLDYDGSMQKAIDKKQWVNFKWPDWKELYDKLSGMSRNELENYVNSLFKGGRKIG